MKYTENNFQGFIAIKPSIVYSGNIFDLSAADRRCSLDKLISTPDITTACDPRQTKFPGGLSCTDMLQFSKCVPCLSSAGLTMALSCLPSPPTRRPLPGPTAGSTVRFWVWHGSGSGTHVPGRALLQDEGAVPALAAPSTFAAPEGGERARNWLEDSGQRFLNSEFGRQMEEEWFLQYCVLRCIYS